MADLSQLLKNQGFQRIPMRISKTNHLLIKATINGVKGDFILDTGASNSCVGFDQADFFNLETQQSDTKAAGAGATNMLTHVATRNLLKIGRWNYSDFNLVVFDLSHVNEALQQHKAKRVQGILGADVLMRGKAIIDYENCCVYLKKNVAG